MVAAPVREEAQQSQLHDEIIYALQGSQPELVLESMLMSQLTINDNTNKAAEQLLTACTAMEKRHSDALLRSLLHILCSSGANVQSRALAAVLLRSQLPSTWPRLSSLTQASVKESLLLCFQQEKNRDVFVKVCYLISDLMASMHSFDVNTRNGDDDNDANDGEKHHQEIANGDSEDRRYDELLAFMLNQCSSDSPIRQREGALLIFTHLLSHYTAFDEVGTDFRQLHGLVKDILMSPLPEDKPKVVDITEDYVHLKVAAIRTTSNFVQALAEGGTDMEPFQDLLSGIIQALTQLALQLKDHALAESSAQRAMEIVTELLDSEPEFVLNRLGEMTDFAFQVVETQLDLQDSTRHLAIEIVLTALEKAREAASSPDEAMKRLKVKELLPNLIKRLFSALLSMLLDVVDDPAWHHAEIGTDYENAGESTNFQAGQEFLDRLADSLGVKNIFPVAQELLPAFISNEDWRKRHAALICVAQMAEGCAKVLTKSPDPTLNMVLGSFKDENPKVRWAAINAIGQMATDLSPFLQEKYHQRILPCLLEAMDDKQNLRIQAHAAAAMSNFSEDIKSDTLAPYLDAIVKKLLSLLQSDKNLVQEEALTALASIADSSQGNFQPYYDSVMPRLKEILMNANDKSSRQLLLKSMECISLIGLAVGKDNFLKDAKDIIQVLLNMHSSQENLEEDDNLTTTYMLQAWARLCKCLGPKELLPHMKVVMPIVLQSAQLKPGLMVLDSEEEDECCPLNGDITSDDDSVETITIGDKAIEIETNVLEEKASACSMLCSCALELKEDFYPWIDQVASILVPLLKFYFHEEVRKNAVSAIPELLTAAKLAIEKGVAVGKDETYVKHLSNVIFPALIEALHKEPDAEVMLAMLNSINKCIQVSGILVNDEHIKALVDELKFVIKTNCIKKETEEDESEEESTEDSEELVEGVLNQVGECFTTLIKTFKNSILPYLEPIMPVIINMMGKDREPQERQIAICICDDVAEQCRELAGKYYEIFLPHFLEACTDEDPDVRQAAVYGLGVCAEFGDAAFAPVAKEAFDKLREFINQPTAYATENVMATDNAVSALGKICVFQKEHIDSAQGMSLWLSCLPIRNDVDEAKVVHEHLCSVVERLVLKELKSDSLSEVIQIFAEILSAGNELASEETLARMHVLLRQMKQNLPPVDLASAWSSLNPEHQAVLQSINLSP